MTQEVRIPRCPHCRKLLTEDPEDGNPNNGPMSVADIYMDQPYPVERKHRGCKKRAQPVKPKCYKCRGNGTRERDSEVVLCEACNGSGVASAF